MRSRSIISRSPGTPAADARTTVEGGRNGRRGYEPEGHGAKPESSTPPWPVAIFIASLFIPWILMIGPLSLSPARLFLIAFFIPGFLLWARGRAGRIFVADMLVLAYSIWSAVALFANHGSEGVQSSGILMVETMGPYFLARLYVRDQTTFGKTLRFGALLILAILPFSIYELFTGKKIILDTLHAIATTFQYGESEIRMGLRRVQGPFEHPILYGVFCASFFSLLTLCGSAATRFRRNLLAATTLFASVLSLSSAPIASGLMQIVLVGWYRLMYAFPFRWKILYAAGLVGYLVIEFGSNQTPIQFYISKFTFDQQTGWYRLAIWQYGSASVASHPLFGIGLADWARPAWMSASTVDNFWLLTAMRYGLPALILLVLAVVAISFGIARRIGHDVLLDNYRTGYLICMFTFAFVGSTVHFWGPVYLWYFFLLGAGVWMGSQGGASEAGRGTTRNRPTPRRHTSNPGASDERRPGRNAAGPGRLDVR